MQKLKQTDPPRNFLLQDVRTGRAAVFYNLAQAGEYRRSAYFQPVPELRASCILVARYHLNIAKYFCETRFLRVRLP